MYELDADSIQLEEQARLQELQQWRLLGLGPGRTHGTPSSQPRSERSRFSLTQAFLPDQLRPAAMYIEPWYLAARDPILSSCALPQVASALADQTGQLTDLWREPIEGPPLLSQQHMTRLLSSIASVLIPPSKDCEVYWQHQLSDTPEDSGIRRFTHQVFSFPPEVPVGRSMLQRSRASSSSAPVETEHVSKCLKVDPMAVANRVYMGLSSQGYLRLQLTFHASRDVAVHEEVFEWAHRVVTWAFHGPPGPGLPHPVAMHLCEQADCLHPGHLQWGTHRDNYPRG